MIEQLSHLKSLVDESFGKTWKGIEFVLVTSLKRDLDQVVECKSLLSRDV
jgi:hypothetical protein